MIISETSTRSDSLLRSISGAFSLNCIIMSKCCLRSVARIYSSTKYLKFTSSSLHLITCSRAYQHNHSMDLLRGIILKPPNGPKKLFSKIHWEFQSEQKSIICMTNKITKKSKVPKRLNYGKMCYVQK